MIILLLLLEAGWLYSLYHAERRDFRYVTGKFIEDAIKEEIYTCPIQETNGLDDFSMKGRLIMTYTYKGKYFHIDTNSQLFLVFYRRKLYDFNRESWNIDSLAAWFRHFCPWEDLNPVFIRQDTTGKIIDRYPADCRKPYRQPDFAQFQLGNLEPDTLTAWFDFPFNRFWLRQRYGLLLSIVPFLFALSFGLLILRREKRRQRNHLLTEKQLIFIHDLKTPFCTSCHIEQHLLQHVGEWPAEKIHEKLNVCRHLLVAITDEMTQLIDRSAGYWGTNPETAGFDLRSMLEEVAARYGGRGDASRIAVDYRLDTPIVQGDSFHLSHIIGNLIDNALRHAGPEANVTVICDADRRGRLRLTVEDNGTGIPRRLHRRIFRPGFRSDRRQPRDRAGLYPEYRPPDRSTAPPRQPAGTRQPFYTDIHSRPKTPLPEDSPIPPVLLLFHRRHNVCRTILDRQPIYRRPESLRQRRTPEPRRSHL